MNKRETTRKIYIDSDKSVEKETGNYRYKKKNEKRKLKTRDGEQ